MAKSGPVWLVLGLVFLGACATQNPPSRESKPFDGQDTVYGESDAASRSGSFSSDEEITEDPAGYAGYDGNIESGVIDVPERDLPQGVDLDWQAVYFEFDSAVLTEQARRQLGEYARILVQHGKLSVLLEGHCDMRGTENYNLALGERRAQTVKRYLAQLGVSPDQVQTISYGELRPADPSDREQAHARNRRVAFTF